MSLASGTRLGPYRLDALVGEGGMGQVYRAVDTRLDRSVAIKVLPPHLSSNPQLRERFEREARAISSLSHPHVCTLYDVGREDGTDYLVMEYLEGETLADRLSRGPLPLKDAIRHGIEISEALAKAHRHGIVHRDLKPGNVMLTKSGAKLLDFGLAKTAASGVLTPDAPTEHQKPLTAEGTLLGTFQYMAPEQVEGREADGRTDIFALGAVLYEMVTGNRAFEAKTKASLIASILDRDPPPIASSERAAPAALDRIIRTCLAKDPDERWQSAHDVAEQLRWIGATADDSGIAAFDGGRKKRRAAVAVGLLVAGLAAGFGAAEYRRRSHPAAVVQASILPPAGAEFRPSDDDVVVVSPDGGAIAFTATDANGTKRLWLRALNDLDARPLPGTEGARHPFWSADGQALAFFSRAKLRKIALDGSPPVAICDVTSNPLNGSWSADGVIVFSPASGASIHQVAASGGRPVAVTSLDRDAGETTHRSARFLPDGKSFLYLAASHSLPENSEVNAIYAARIGSNERKLIVRARSSFDYADGHLLFVRDNTLFAQRFDPDELQLRGAPLAIAKGVHHNGSSFYSAFSGSRSGRLVYVSAAGPTKRHLVRLGDQGQETGLIGEAVEYRTASLSPDRKTLAISIIDPAVGIDIWLHDLERDARTRLTRGGAATTPVWSPDGTRIAYTGAEDEVFVTTIDGSRAAERLFRTGAWGGPVSWSPDGRHLTFWKFDPKTPNGYDALILPLDGERKLIPLAATTAAEWPESFSPDGRWVLYTSDEAGRSEVYVASFPDLNPRQQVSVSGGSAPIWSGAREISYRQPDGTWVAVSLADRPDAPPAISAARPIFRNPQIVELLGRDLSGRLLAVRQTSDDASQQIVLVSDWRALLELIRQ